MIDPNAPAFPIHVPPGHELTISHVANGITIRAHFAIALLPSVYSLCFQNAKDIASAAVKHGKLSMEEAMDLAESDEMKALDSGTKDTAVKITLELTDRLIAALNAKP